LKTRKDGITTTGGKLFQIQAVATPKTQSPTIFGLVQSTISMLVADNHSILQQSLSAA